RRSEQLDDIGRADCALVTGAEADSAQRYQIQRNLIAVGREVVLWVAVPRLAIATLEGETLDESMLDQRDAHLAEQLLHLERAAVRSSRVRSGEIAALIGFVRPIIDEVLAILGAEVDRRTFLGPRTAHSPLIELCSDVDVRN